MSERKCNVLFILNSLSAGGAEKQVISLLNGMNNNVKYAEVFYKIR